MNTDGFFYTHALFSELILVMCPLSFQIIFVSITAFAKMIREKYAKRSNYICITILLLLVFLMLAK